jgi:outer membrane protein OmpA-like peptidoglycan-associated protein
MYGQRHIPLEQNREEAEKPFWISFSDLMSALMVLFLVVMGVALLAITKTVSEQERKGKAHKADIDLILQRFEDAASRHQGITVDKDRYVIDFGSRAQFDFGKSQLYAEQETVLREFVPEMLALASDSLGRRILKRFVIEGYTDTTGSYLRNLNLSLQRSQRVLCALFAQQGERVLSNDQKEQVRQLFFVGGYSFNSAKATPEESRRVEMRLEFLGIDESRPTPVMGKKDFGTCAL